MTILRSDGGVLACNCCRGDGYWRRLSGLMFRSDWGDWDGLWLDRNNAIHMWFVRFAIDLVWLDAERRVVGLRPNLRPWRVAWQRGAQSCLEFPLGVIERSGLQVGERLIFDTEQPALTVERAGT